MKIKKYLKIGAALTTIRFAKTLWVDESRENLNDKVKETSEKLDWDPSAVSMLFYTVAAIILIITWPVWVLVKVNDR